MPISCVSSEQGAGYCGHALPGSVLTRSPPPWRSASYLIFSWPCRTAKLSEVDQSVTGSHHHLGHLGHPPRAPSSVAELSLLGPLPRCAPAPGCPCNDESSLRDRKEHGLLATTGVVSLNLRCPVRVYSCAEISKCSTRHNPS